MDIQTMLLESYNRVSALQSAYAIAGLKIQEAIKGIKEAEQIGGFKVAAQHKPTRTDLLTPKEKEIFLLLGQGLTPKQISKKLGRSQKTIEAHRETMRNKLGHSSSFDLTREAKSPA